MINELMKRLSELPNVTMDDGQEYIQLYDAMETVKRALEIEPTSPCDVCRFNPPSSTDGKPCSMCPAERRTDVERRI